MSDAGTREPIRYWRCVLELRFTAGLGYCRFPSSILNDEVRSRMITGEAVTNYIRKAMPDAHVSVTDKTGTMDHLIVRVVSDAFKGKNLLDRHRMVYQALDEPMKDGRIHALEITADTSES